MSHGESAFIFEQEASSIDRACRAAFLKVLSILPEGHMTIQENGTTVGEFGNPSHDLKADVNILNVKAYRQLLFGGSVAAGETYTDGLWTSSDLTSVIRIFARNLPMLDFRRYSIFSAAIRKFRRKKISKPITIWAISFIPAFSTSR